MSTHLRSIPLFADGQAVSEAIASLPSPIDFLPADSAALFVPVNTDRNWATSAGKRVLDLLFAVPLLVLFAPLMAAIAVLVRIDSKGPALFRQTRTGICDRTFRILKFRTMHVLEDGDAVIQARRGDPRTTRLGRFLRRHSLDELPQLINVVVGDMSLVGPRPHACAHDRYYGDLIDDYRHRYAVKPGITGWAQICGHRGPTPTIETMTRRVTLDTWYARNASCALDLKILLRTPFEIFRPRNAF